MTDLPRNGRRPAHPNAAMTRRRLIAVSGAGLAGGLMAHAGVAAGAVTGRGGVAASALAQETSGAAGGRLTIGIGSLPNTPDPHLDSTANALPAYAQMFEKLVTADGSGGLAGTLAESWANVAPDTWEIKLRPGITFHNGEDFTADAVKFSIERVLNPETKSPWIGRISAITSVEAVDELTVRITTQGPFAPLMQGLSVVDIIPPRYFQEVSAQGAQAFAEAPVGTGPFRFKEWVKQDHLTVQANDTYWRGRPRLDEVVFRSVPADQSRVAGLEAGDLDVALLLAPEQVERLEGAGFTVEAVNVGQGMVVNLRQVPGTPLEDQLVRQALNYAIDKETIFEQLLLGYGRILDGQIVGPDAFGYNPDLKPYPYDPEKARDLLAQAGYGDGFEVTFNGSIGRYTKDKEIVEAIIGQLAEVGVTAKLEVLEAGVFIQSYLAGTIGPMFIWAWQYLPAMDADLPLNFFRSTGVSKLMSDPQYDQLVDAERSALVPEERRQILQQMASFLNDDPPCIFLFQTPAIYGFNAKVQGFSWQPTYLFDLTNVTVGQ